MTTEQQDLARVEVKGITRHSLILRGALAAGATFGLGAVTPFVSSALAASSDLDILNFALTLEYLEADFYTKVAKTASLSGDAKKYAKEFGDQETMHVDGLTAAIKAAGGTPAAMPTFDFSSVTDQKSFLSLAYVLENTGVSAYNGAGPSLMNKMYLATAGEIVQVEARHAATIALLTNKKVTPDGAFDKPLKKAQVLKIAGPLIKS